MLTRLLKYKTINHCKSTNHFLPGAQYTKFAKAHMEWGTSEGSIGLLNNNNIDGSSESGCIDLIVEVTKVADDLADVIHAVHVLDLPGGLPPT